VSVLRVLAAAVVVGLTLLVAPAAIAPGVNGADLIVLAAPIALLLICAPRSPDLPAGGSTPQVDVPHVTEPPAGTPS
jgi:hypothetical protein